MTLVGSTPAALGGGEALAAILGGQVTVGISGYGEFASQIQAGELRLIGISSDSEVAGIDAPTFKEGGVDVSIQNWRMVAAAPGLSDEQKAAVSADVEKMAKSAAWKKILADKGWADTYLAGPDFAAQLKKDVLWAGNGKYAELWDAKAWKDYFDTTDDERQQISSRLAELGL